LRGNASWHPNGSCSSAWCRISSTRPHLVRYLTTSMDYCRIGRRWSLAPKSGESHLGLIQLLGTLGCLCGLSLLTLLTGFRFLLMRPDHHAHIATIFLWCAFNGAQVLHVIRKTFQQAHPHLWTRLFTTAEHDHDFDFVAAL